MFGSMMDPDMMRIAQEQMSRFSPEDLQRMQQQIMSNPDLIRVATEGMKNMRPEDLKFAAEQMRNIPPDQMADFSARASSFSPEQIAGMRAASEAHRTYEFQGALSLKNQGNKLHTIGKYSEAAEKYLRAKDNLKGLNSPEADNLQLTCSLNLMSCYLKTKQFSEAIAEGTAVLNGDPSNVKALYRRGQAYKQLGELKLAVKDLGKASEISPDDETIADVLREAKAGMDAHGGDEELSLDGCIIEESSDQEVEQITSRGAQSLANLPSDRMDARNGDEQGLRDFEPATIGRHELPTMPDSPAFGESYNALRQNPDMIRNMHSMLSTVNPEQLVALSGGNMTPEMVKFASGMMKQMSPEDLERMVGLASSLGVPRGGPAAARSSGTGQSSLSQRSMDLQGTSMSASGTPVVGLEPSPRSEATTPGLNMPSMANFSPEMQEEMQMQMKNPAMKQMMAAMVKNMTPEILSSMSEQMGMKLSPEQAIQAQQAMANLNPADFDRLMVWAERFRIVMEQGKRVKNWLFGRPGLILAIVMLIFAIVLHRLGYIGA